MTTHQARRHRARRGWMSGMKKPSGHGRTPLWQWLVGIPLIAIVGIAIISYLYVTYVNPKLATGERWVKGEVLERVEKKRPDGTLDMAASSLVVTVEGRPLRLAPAMPAFDTVAKGDVVEVKVATTAGTLQGLDWRVPTAPLTSTSAPRAPASPSGPPGQAAPAPPPR